MHQENKRIVMPLVSVEMLEKSLTGGIRFSRIKGQGRTQCLLPKKH